MGSTQADISAVAFGNAFYILPSLIDAVGKKQFGGQLLTVINELCGADYCIVYKLHGGRPFPVLASNLHSPDIAQDADDLHFVMRYWRQDPSLATCQKLAFADDASLLRVNVGLPDRCADRGKDCGSASSTESIVIHGQAAGHRIGLSVLRSEEGNMFAEADITTLREYAPILLSALGKHIDAIGSTQSDEMMSLRSLSQIEDCMMNAPENLSKREVEVCARFLYGMSYIGIALDLGISEETVTTYRKRAYQRLNIGSRRELLFWYLGRRREERIKPIPAYMTPSAASSPRHKVKQVLRPCS